MKCKSCKQPAKELFRDGICAQCCVDTDIVSDPNCDGKTHEPHCPVPRAANRGEGAVCLCAPGCTNNSKPYCHCQDCGNPTAILNEDGYCQNCVAKQDLEAVRCYLCVEQKAVVRLSVTDTEGILLDYKWLCKECLKPFVEAGLEPGPAYR